MRIPFLNPIHSALYIPHLLQLHVSLTVVMVSMELVDSPSPVPESASSITVSVSVVGLDLDTEGDMLIRLGLSTVPITAKGNVLL